MSNKCISQREFEHIHSLADCLVQKHLAKKMPLKGVQNNNWVFLAETETGHHDYMVKFVPSEEGERLKVEVSLNQLLDSETVLANPRIITSGEIGDKLYLIREIIPGRSMAEVLKAEDASVEQLCNQAGECLAQIHTIKFDTKGILQSDLTVKPQEVWSLEEMKAFLPPIYEAGLISRHQMQGLLSLAVDDFYHSDEFVLCHCDYTPNNILARDGEVVGVIDFEWASAAPVYDDLATFDFFLRYNNREEYIADFYQGYEQVKSVPQKYLDHQAFYRFYRLITMLSYQLRATDERFDGEFHQWMRERVTYLMTDDNFASEVVPGFRW